MALEADAGQIVVNDSRGIEPHVALRTLQATYGHPQAAVAMKEAGLRQNAVVSGLQLAVAQGRHLQDQIAATAAAATALKTTLEAAKTAALTDLDNATAGDAAVTALTTLLTNLATALTAIGGVSSMTYRTYRDA